MNTLHDCAEATNRLKSDCVSFLEQHEKGDPSLAVSLEEMIDDVITVCGISSIFSETLIMVSWFRVNFCMSVADRVSYGYRI